MRERMDLWTFLIITVVSVVVWFLAAAKTRMSETFTVPITFSPPDPADPSDPPGWRLDPEAMSVSMSVEGSQWAIGQFEQVKRALSIDVPAVPGPQEIDLLPAIRALPQVRTTGIAVVSIFPAQARLTVDRLTPLAARVRPSLSNFDAVEDVAVTPNQVTVTIPESLRSRLGASPTMQAVIGREQLDRLEPGVTHTIENVPVLPPEGALPSGIALEIDPPTVTVTLTIRSQIRELHLASPVRIKLVGAPEDTERVELVPKQLRDVTVRANESVIHRIEANDAVVMALLFLKSSEKESRIATKRISSFIAVMPDGSFKMIEARVGAGGGRQPEIALTITEPPPPRPE